LNPDLDQAAALDRADAMWRDRPKLKYGTP
jgi:hypothetical protein